ncbi:MAG: hypothetical protein H7239_12570 [Flavobacterium sp.]|nr:hypothetical protein [Flavobacterium sp.]
MKKTLILFGIILLLSSCGHDFNENIISNFDRYKVAKTILDKNLHFIKKAVNFQEYDSIKQLSNSIIFDSNKYYFENTILANRNDELKKVVALWNDKLILNDVASGTITLKNDGVIIFCTASDIGEFSGVGHYIVYDPKDNNGELGKKDSEILKEKVLDIHWKYIIEKRYYVD